jgi:hypothetical protein
MLSCVLVVEKYMELIAFPRSFDLGGSPTNHCPHFNCRCLCVNVNVSVSHELFSRTNQSAIRANISATLSSSLCFPTTNEPSSQLNTQLIFDSAIHPFIHPFIRSFIHSFIHLFIYSFIHLLVGRVLALPCSISEKLVARDIARAATY